MFAAKVNSGCVIGDGCVVGVGVEVPAGTVLANNTVLFKDAFQSRVVENLKEVNHSSLLHVLLGVWPHKDVPVVGP